MATTAVVALGSVALLTAAVTGGWLGPDVGRGAGFCEAARDGLVRQPANTFSNAGFVLAGLLIARRARHSAALGDVLPRFPGLTTWLACVVVLLGPASAAMHATQSAWGGHLDMLSMYLIAGLTAAYALTRWRRAGTGTFIALFSAAVALCELVGLWSRPVPVVQFAGNVAFAALLLLAVGVEVALRRRGETTIRFGYGVAALASMLVAFGIWNLAQGPWCAPHSWLQGHAVWHLLGAVAAYLLFRMYASERDPADVREPVARG